MELRFLSRVRVPIKPGQAGRGDFSPPAFRPTECDGTAVAERTFKDLSHLYEGASLEDKMELRKHWHVKVRCEALNMTTSSTSFVAISCVKHRSEMRSWKVM